MADPRAPDAQPSQPSNPGAPLTREQEGELIAEYEDSFISCLQDEGIGVTVITEQGGGWEFDPGGLDDDAFFRIGDMCVERAGGQPSIAPPTRSEASRLYDLTVDAKECLEAQGAVVSVPPSREVWVESFLDTSAAATGPWSPYGPGMLTEYGPVCPPPPDVTDLQSAPPVPSTTSNETGAGGASGSLGDSSAA